MGPVRDKMAGKGDTSKNLDPSKTKQRTPTSGSTQPTVTPAISHGTSTADVATAIDAAAKTLVSNKASNVQTTPRITAERPHEGPIISNASRTKASDQAGAVKTRTPSNSKADGRSVDKPQPAKSEGAKDDESDEIESLLAAYRPVDGTSAARPSSSNPLSRGPNFVGLGMASTATTTPNTASEASKRTATTFNTIDATGANKAVTTIEAPTSLFGGPSTLGVPRVTATNPNTTSIPPKSFFTTSSSSQTRNVPFLGVPGTLSSPEQKPNVSGASTLPVDFGTAPTPNPATTIPFSLPKMAGTAAKTNLATENPFGWLKTAYTAPTPNMITNRSFSSSKALATDPVPNPISTSPFGQFTLPRTAPGPNPAITSPFGVFETARTPNSATTSPFGAFNTVGSAPTPNPTKSSPFNVFKMTDTAPTPNPATTSPFGAFNMVGPAPTPNPAKSSPVDVFKMTDTATTSPFGAFNTVGSAPTPNPAKSSPFDVYKMTDTAPTPNSATKSPFGTVKVPAENIFSKSNFPTSNLGGSQAKGFFGNLSEQASQSKSNSFDFGSTVSSPFPYTAPKSTGFYPGNVSNIEPYKPAIFNDLKLPPIKPDFNPKMATAEGLSNTYQPMVPYDHYQPRDHSPSIPFKSLQTDNPFSTANVTGSSITQQTGNLFRSPLTPTIDQILLEKPENLIAYQKYVLQELQTTMGWLSEQNEIVSRNLAISTENLGVCGAQLQYFSKRCNELNETCEEHREGSVKLQEELDKVNEMHEAEKEKANQALKLHKKEKYTSLSIFAICVHILVCILVTWLVPSIHNKFS